MTDSFAIRAALVPDRATDHILGPDEAPVTLIEYGDFECPGCKEAYPEIKALLARHGNRLRFVFRHFPLREFHPHAELAAEASEAAAAQHRFWPFHDLLFEHSLHLDRSHLSGFAQRLGLDLARFENELNDNVYLQRVQEQARIGQGLQVRGTPAFFVNGESADVSFGIEHLNSEIERALSPEAPKQLPRDWRTYLDRRGR
ncbi:MAG TPA: DsbA family protein [Variovorax sp.]